MATKAQPRQSKLTTDEKVNMLFRYMFNLQSADDEERFWNELSAVEVKELNNIRKEETISFEQLKAMSANHA